MSPEEALVVYELVFGCPLSLTQNWRPGEYAFCEELARAIGYSKLDPHTLSLAQRGYITVKEVKQVQREQAPHSRV